MKRTAIFLLFCALGGGALSADELLVPLGADAPSLEALPRPTRGMSSQRVLESYGEPMTMQPPVGDPPISRWRYEDFTVYFESDTVIHSVVRRDRGTP